MVDEWGEMKKGRRYKLGSMVVIGCGVVLLGIGSCWCLGGMICVRCINVIGW